MLGAAQIAPKAVIAPLRNSTVAILSGIAARDVDRAVNFSQRYDIPDVYESYQSLVDSDKIDAVYIPLANHMHCEWIIKCAEAGKHILVEKPICLSSAQFSEIEYHIGKNRVHLLEGLMVQHHPWQKKVAEILRSGAFGKVIAATTTINFESNYPAENYRWHQSSGGGVFWDVGSYWIQFLQSCINIPILRIDGTSVFDGPNGIDQDIDAAIKFTDGIQCTFSASFHRPFTARHTIILEKALINIGNFFRPAIRKSALSITINCIDGKKEFITFSPECLYENQISFFIDVITGKRKNLPITDMRERIDIMEQVYRSARRTFHGEGQ